MPLRQDLDQEYSRARELPDAVREAAEPRRTQAGLVFQRKTAMSENG
jgi:hypothetical protein